MAGVLGHAHEADQMIPVLTVIALGIALGYVLHRTSRSQVDRHGFAREDPLPSRSLFVNVGD